MPLEVSEDQARLLAVLFPQLNDLELEQVEDTGASVRILARTRTRTRTRAATRQRTPSCSCYGMRTRSYAASSPARSATSPRTGSGSPRCPPSYPATAGATSSRSPPEPCWPGTVA